MNFEEGDVVNGLYRVVSNEAINDHIAEQGFGDDASSRKGECALSGRRIVMSMKQGEVEGRMAFTVLTEEHVGSEEQATTAFSTDTYMWLPRSSRAVMPLERKLPQWGHELTSWWLLEKGTAHLRDLRKVDAEGHKTQMR